MRATAEGMIPMTAEEEAAFNAEIGQVRIPAEVTALQGMLAINASGLASSYESWASNQSRTFAEKAFINKALVWKRTDPVLLAGAQSLGLTSDQVDQLFITAATL
jgi:glutamate dehydrogenase/leucine dehydrogenase